MAFNISVSNRTNTWRWYAVSVIRSSGVAAKRCKKQTAWKVGDFPHIRSGHSRNTYNDAKQVPALAQRVSPV